MPPTSRPLVTATRFIELFGSAPVSSAAAYAAGFTRGEVRRAVQRGLLSTPRRGILQAPAHAHQPTPEGARIAHLARLRVVLAAISPDAVATHESAALVHRLPLPRAQVPGDIQVCVTDKAGFVAPDVVVRRSPIPASDVAVVDGIRVTSLARTAVDLARGCSLPSALIPLDAAARLIVADLSGSDARALRWAVHEETLRTEARHRLSAAWSSVYAWSGTAVLRTVLPLVDPASESPLESRSRGWFHEADLPRLRIGWPIPVAGTTYWADFASPERRLIGEADGWAKYGETLDQVRDAVAAERDRQAELEAAGWRVTRWRSPDPREAVIARMRRALLA